MPENLARIGQLEILIGRVIRKGPDEAAQRISNFLNQNGMGALNRLAKKSQFALFVKAQMEAVYFGDVALSIKMRLDAKKASEEEEDAEARKLISMIPSIIANYEGIEKFQSSNSAMQICMGVYAAVNTLTNLEEMGDALVARELLSDQQLEDKLGVQRKLLLIYDEELYKFRDGGMKVLRWVDRFAYCVAKPVEMQSLIDKGLIKDEAEYLQIPFVSLASHFDDALERIRREG